MALFILDRNCAVSRRDALERRSVKTGATRERVTLAVKIRERRGALQYLVANVGTDHTGLTWQSGSNGMAGEIRSVGSEYHAI